MNSILTLFILASLTLAPILSAQEGVTKEQDSNTGSTATPVTEGNDTQVSSDANAAPEESASPIVQNFILDRSILGFDLGLASASSTYVTSGQGFASFIFDYRFGDLVFKNNKMLETFYGGFEYTGLSMQATKDKTFYRVSGNMMILNAGLELPLSFFSKGPVWKENVMINVAGGLGFILNNTLDSTLQGNNAYQRKLPGGVIMALKGQIAYRFFGPWQAAVNLRVDLGSTNAVLFGMGVRSGF